LATGGGLTVMTSGGEEFIQLRRIHLEEDTGKLMHCASGKEKYSLVDLNRAGIGLLEIVTEPVLTSLEAVKAYSTGLRSILKYLKVCSGNMEKGAIRFEANISMRPEFSRELGTRVEIKNLNSFRAMERAIKYEMKRQTALLTAGGKVELETLGWDENNDRTVSQRSKEEAHDYRYFPEPDLPPLTISEDWLSTVRANMPELPLAKKNRFINTLKLTEYQADLICNEMDVALYFEQALQIAPKATAQQIANWLTGDIYAYLNQNELSIGEIRLTPDSLVHVIEQVESGKISRANGREVLQEALSSGNPPDQIIQARGFMVRSNEVELQNMVIALIAGHPSEVSAYHSGKVTLIEWFLGQAMRQTRGSADPAQMRELIRRYLDNPDEK